MRHRLNQERRNNGMQMSTGWTLELRTGSFHEPPRKLGIPQGTYSHDTALSLHELSDIMPSKLHMTVPKEFRRNSRFPEILVLHQAHLDTTDVQEMYGVRVTRPLRTIMDLLQSGQVDRSQLKRAVDEAVRRGLVGRKEIDRMPHDKLHGSLRELAGQHA